MLAVTTGVPVLLPAQPGRFRQPANRRSGRKPRAIIRSTRSATRSATCSTSTQLNSGEIRITVGASNVRTSEMRYFDSRDMPLGLEHIMASGALPPAFPAVRIDGELYWDGGILSNTPVEVVFDDAPRAQLDGLRRPHLEPGRRRAGDDPGSDEPAEGHPIFEPRRRPHQAPAPAPPPAPHRRRAQHDASGGPARATIWSPSWPATAA